MSAFKKSPLVAGVAMVLSNNAFVDEDYDIVRFKSEAISVPCSIELGNEDLIINLDKMTDTVLKSSQKSLAGPFATHLQDCMPNQGGTTYSKTRVTFTTANIMTGQPDLLKDIKETEIDGAAGAGVRILDSQDGEVALGTPVVITFNNTSSYQGLNFKARMESPNKDVIPNSVYARVDYRIAYE